MIKVLLLVGGFRTKVISCALPAGGRGIVVNAGVGDGATVLGAAAVVRALVVRGGVAGPRLAQAGPVRLNISSAARAKAILLEPNLFLISHCSFARSAPGRLVLPQSLGWCMDGL